MNQAYEGELSRTTEGVNLGDEIDQGSVLSSTAYQPTPENDVRPDQQEATSCNAEAALKEQLGPYWACADCPRPHANGQ